jgi:lipid-A-disaccharide synthase
MTDALLVVAGEASGDRAAAGVVRALGPGTRAFGMGGGALASAGVELVCDLRASTALGLGEVAARAVAIRRAFGRVLVEAKRRRPRAALLVNYTEFNARLACTLHEDGVRVLWYIAPQIWAWRPGRARTLRKVIDRMAVILPFEEDLWRKQGVDARYVGHPAREAPALDRDRARAALGLTPWASAVAILPGSRPHEVRRLLVPMLEAYEMVRHEHASVDARVLLAPSLDPPTRAWALKRVEEARVEHVDIDASRGVAEVMRAFDASLCASGTAALESALARAIPVVAYRVGLLAEALARSLVVTKHVALPNVLLGRAAFAELVQREVRPNRLAEALEVALERPPGLVGACDELEHILGPSTSPSREVARMLRPWL